MFNKDIIISGNHAKFVKELADKELGLFSRYIDVYMNSIIIGLFFNRIEEKDNVYHDEVITIPLKTVLNEQSKLEYLYRLTVLLEEQRSLDTEKKVERAFKDDSLENDTSFKENINLFDSYALGGISIMYENIIGEDLSKEQHWRNAYKFMRKMNRDVKDDDEILGMID